MSIHSWHDQHMVRTTRSLVKTLYITIGIFLLLFVSLHIARALYISNIAEKSINAFNAGIQQDMSHLKKEGDELAMDSRVQEYLISKDSERLVELTRQEIITRDIGLVGVMDSNGVLLSRTKSAGNLGNNIFLTNPVGRILAKGESAQSVEATVGFNPRQIFLTTGRPIVKDGQMIGALTANYLTDDAYAVKFRDAYLPRGAQVVFYSKDAGIYGNSFTNPIVRKIISSYFSSGAQSITEEISSKTVFFEDGDFYLIKNIVFPGLEESPGGALIFIPRAEISYVVNLIAALLTVGFFLLFALRYHMRSRGEEWGWRYCALICIISVPIFFLAFFVLQLQNVGYLKLEQTPYPLYNSTLRIQPDFGVYNSGFEQTLSVMVDTGDEAINVVSIGLLFDPQAVEVKFVDTTNSTCEYVIEKIIDMQKGRVDLTCAVLKSGGEKGTLLIADIVLMPQKTGTFNLSFDAESTEVLASDGLGTNVLRASTNGSYQVDDFDSGLSRDLGNLSSSTSTKRSFVVFSPTHPNKSRWYNLRNARFVWRGEVGAVYRYVFDSSPHTVPLKGTTTMDSSASIHIPGDGVFYFHIQLASGGPIAHYRVQVDTTPPRILSVKVSSEKVFVGDVVRLTFDAQDTGSGVQKNYYVDLGNHLFLPIGSQLFIPFMKAGEQNVTLRVYDDAHNYSEKTQVITVEEL